MLRNGEPPTWERIAAIVASVAALVLAIAYALYS
jgi:hypothetical protein